MCNSYSFDHLDCSLYKLVFDWAHHHLVYSVCYYDSSSAIEVNVILYSVEMGQMAAEAALQDAGIPYDKVQAVAASYCYGDPTCGT